MAFATSFPCIILAASLISFTVALLLIRSYGGRDKHPHSERLFLQRLALYADMQALKDEEKPVSDLSYACAERGFCVTNLNHRPAAFVLQPKQHKILLGILKKIEAKWVALATILIFALSAIVTVIVAANIELITILMLHCASGILAALLVASADGAYHLGQPHFNRLSRGNDFRILGRELQIDLIRDAVKKERRFEITRYLLVAVLFIIFMALFLEMKSRFDSEHYTVKKPTASAAEYPPYPPRSSPE